MSYERIVGYFWLLEELNAAGADVLHIDSQFSNRWSQNFQIPVYHCRGNLSFATNNPDIASYMMDWSWNASKYYAPKSFEDIDDTFEDHLAHIHSIADVNHVMRTAFTLENNQEDVDEHGTLDRADDGGDGDVLLPPEVEDVMSRETEIGSVSG